MTDDCKVNIQTSERLSRVQEGRHTWLPSDVVHKDSGCLLCRVGQACMILLLMVHEWQSSGIYSHLELT